MKGSKEGAGFGALGLPGVHCCPSCLVGGIGDRPWCQCYGLWSGSKECKGSKEVKEIWRSSGDGGGLSVFGLMSKPAD